MTISDAFLKIQIGANLKPDSPLSGAVAAGFAVESKPANRKNVLAATVIFSAAGQSAVFDAVDGSHNLSAIGTAQVETATVTAAAGATANGNLALTLTSNIVAGSPLAISVPLSVYNHKTADQIAAAIADKLNATAAVATYFTATATANKVALKSKYGFANDTTLNLAIAAGLGVSAAASSVNTTTGVLGAIVQRAGGSGKDVFGGAWGAVSAYFHEIAIRGIQGVSPASVREDYMGDILPGEVRAATSALNTVNLLTFIALDGPSSVEVVAFAL